MAIVKLTGIRNFVYINQKPVTLLEKVTEYETSTPDDYQHRKVGWRKDSRGITGVT